MLGVTDQVSLHLLHLDLDRAEGFAEELALVHVGSHVGRHGGIVEFAAGPGLGDERVGMTLAVDRSVEPST